MNWSLIACVATLNSFFASVWSWSEKSNKFWFAGLKTNRWNLCFTVAIDWGLTLFPRNTVTVSAKLFLLGLLIFLNVWYLSPRMREWKWCISFSSVSRMSNFRLVWTRSSNSSNSSDFPSKIGIVVMRDLGNFNILLRLVLNMAEILLLSNSWGANKIWSASIVAGVVSLRNYDWLVERACFDFVKRSQESKTECFLELLSPCERSRPGPSQLDCCHNKQRTPLQDGDHSGNNPRLVLGFRHQRSGMFPERFRRTPVSVVSRDIRLTWTEHPRCGTLSCWIPGIVT